MPSNNYNLCTKCGAGNSVSAKYCYQCGNAMIVAARPVECVKCHTINNGVAKFCKNCGGLLKLAVVETKVCPICNAVGHVNDSVCIKCNHSFGVAQSIPVTRVSKRDVRSIKKLEKGEKKATRSAQKSVNSVRKAKKGIRFASVMVFMLTLAITYLMVMPDMFKWELVNFGMFSSTINGTTTAVTGYSSILIVIGWILKEPVNGSPLEYINGFFVAIMGLLFVIIALEYFVRALLGKRPKHINVCLILMLVASLIYTAGIFVTGLEVLPSWLSFLTTLTGGAKVGCTITTYAVPAVTLVLVILTSVFKQNKQKEEIYEMNATLEDSNF